MLTMLAPAPETEAAKEPCEVFLVPVSALEEVWPVALPMLEPAIARNHGSETADDVLDQLYETWSQLWVVIQDRKTVMAMTTCIVLHPRYRALRTTYMGGAGRDDWLGPLIEAMETWGRANGCAKIEYGGRRGWERALKKHGFEVVGVIGVRDIGDG